MRPGVFLLLALLLVAPGCGPGRAEELRAEIAGLEEQIKELEQNLPVLEDMRQRLVESRAGVQGLERMVDELRRRADGDRRRGHARTGEPPERPGP